MFKAGKLRPVALMGAARFRRAEVETLAMKGTIDEDRNLPSD